MNINKQLMLGFVIGVATMLVYNGMFVKRSAAPSAPVPVGKVTKTSSGSGITFPLAGFSVKSPETVAGMVNGVFENQFMVSVLDANGRELGQARATAYGDIGMPAVFVEEISFTKSTTETGTVEIWDQSAKDGSKQVIDSVDVRFQ